MSGSATAMCGSNMKVKAFALSTPRTTARPSPIDSTNMALKSSSIRPFIRLMFSLGISRREQDDECCYEHLGNGLDRLSSLRQKGLGRNLHPNSCLDWT